MPGYGMKKKPMKHGGKVHGKPAKKKMMYGGIMHKKKKKK